MDAGIFLLQRLQPSHSHTPRSPHVEVFASHSENNSHFHLAAASVFTRCHHPKTISRVERVEDSQGFPDVPGIFARAVVKDAAN